VDRVLAAAEQALSGPLVLSRGEAQLAFAPADLAALLEVERAGADLELAVDPDRLDGLVDAELREHLESEPQDAEFEIAGDTVEIVPSTDGFRFDPERAAEQLVDVATGRGAREAELDGEAIAPAFTTADAEALGIVERVSSFTTHFQAGQSRVVNIHRIADLVNGVIIAPGDTFSVNGHVGRRTRDNGFVEGGAILHGEFVSAVGGGVSQFATTMYNAAYFGGYELVRYKAHSYYISRYPMGREATLNYPTVDLEIRNNSPYGLLIEATTTGSSVTVTTWGTEWVEVESVTGEPFNVRQGRVRNGFDVVDTRVLRFPDGRVEREERFTRYLPEN
jgi:vancomycin resistance protein YoaR